MHSSQLSPSLFSDFFVKKITQKMIESHTKGLLHSGCVAVLTPSTGAFGASSCRLVGTRKKALAVF
jgi:hypothetical protein